MSFYTKDHYIFYLNNKGYGWHKPNISLEEMREYTQFKEEELWLKNVEIPDEQIKAGQVINLERYPHRRFFSGPAMMTYQIKNDRPVYVLVLNTVPGKAPGLYYYKGFYINQSPVTTTDFTEAAKFAFKDEAEAMNKYIFSGNYFSVQEHMYF